jgi:hypothetical protein
MLWSIFVKELIIASRGFYFYIELVMAFVLLIVLLFVVPEHFDNKENEYLYLELSDGIHRTDLHRYVEDLDGQPETVTLKADKQEIDALLYETEDNRIYVLSSEADMVLFAREKHEVGAAIVMDEDDYEIQYTYYLQGNETQRMKNLVMVIHGPDDMLLYDAADNQQIETLGSNQVELNDRENLLPVFLAFNGALLGFFIISAYIFLDKKEGVIKAYAITPSPVGISAQQGIGPDGDHAGDVADHRRPADGPAREQSDAARLSDLHRSFASGLASSSRAITST